MYVGHFHSKWLSLILFTIKLDLFFPMSLPLSVIFLSLSSFFFGGGGNVLATVLVLASFYKQHQLESLGKKELLRYCPIRLAGGVFS